MDPDLVMCSSCIWMSPLPQGEVQATLRSVHAPTVALNASTAPDLGHLHGLQFLPRLLRGVELTQKNRLHCKSGHCDLFSLPPLEDWVAEKASSLQLGARMSPTPTPTLALPRPAAWVAPTLRTLFSPPCFRGVIAFC